MKNKESGTDVSLFCEEKKMMDLTFRQLQAYLLEHYQQSRTEEGLFIKLVEEVGEVAEVLNGRSVEKRASRTQMRN